MQDIVEGEAYSLNFGGFITGIELTSTITALIKSLIIPSSRFEGTFESKVTFSISSYALKYNFRLIGPLTIAFFNT